jgi:DNA-binding transcriptional regulator YiaG
MDSRWVRVTLGGRQRMALTAAKTLTGGTSSEGRVSGYVFKLVRESLGVTQQGLAEHLLVGVATIQGWESGRRPLMAMPAGNFLALRNRLRCLGATFRLLRALTLALETDHFLAEALATPHHQAEPAAHPLGSWVLSRPLTEMTAWQHRVHGAERPLSVVADPHPAGHGGRPRPSRRAGH